mgnify:FL=1
MRDLKDLRKSLSKYIEDADGFDASAFVKVESGLFLLSRVSPSLNPENAYVLLRGYQIINHSKKDEQLYLLQQAREKLFVYSSKMLWSEHFKIYLDAKYDCVRFYNIDGDKLVKNDNCNYVVDREEIYQSELYSKVPKSHSIPYAKAGSYKFYKNNKQIVTVEIPEWFAAYGDKGEKRAVSQKSQRASIELSYQQLIDTADRMREIVPEDYCYNVLKDNELISVKDKSEVFTIDKITNIVGMVGSGKSTLINVLCFYLANKGYKTVIVLNSVNDVVKLYRYFKKFNLSVSPLIGKSNQENYVGALMKQGELFIDEDISEYLTAPCVLNGLCQDETAWEYSERPCYKLYPCKDNEGNNREKCPMFNVCRGSAMLREANSSSIVITTVAGLAASYVGENRALFLENVIKNADVVLFDECDRVQETLDDFFAPNTAFNDFMITQANGCAQDMRKGYSEITCDRNERRYYELARETAGIYENIVDDIRRIEGNEKGVWPKIVTATFSSITLIEQLSKDGIDKKLESSLRTCIYQTDPSGNDFVEQLSEIVDDSCRINSHLNARLLRLLKAESIELQGNNLVHVKLLMKVILFDRMIHRIDDAAKSVDMEILHNNNISDFLQARFIAQQKYLPSAPMGNMFGMMYSNSDQKLKVYRQYACGRYLMLSMPWLRVDEQGNPCGPHAVLLSGSSYAPGSLQYNVELPVDYILKSPERTRGYLDNSKFTLCGSDIVVSGSRQSDRREKISALLRDIHTHVVSELERPGKILFVVNSYDEAKNVWDDTNNLMREIGREEKCAVLVRDDETAGAGQIKKNQLEYFGDSQEKILVAPASVICRGYNIVDSNGNSSLRSVFFLVRPMQVPDDISLKVSKLNGWISQTFNYVKVNDWGIYADKLKNEAGKFWGMLERDSGVSGLNFLSDESKKDIVATVFIMLDQIFGRVARVRELSVIGEPPRIYFADGAFCGGRGGTSFNIIKEILSYLEKLVSEDGHIAETLYGAFYKALKENSYGQEIADDGVYSENYYD